VKLISYGGKGKISFETQVGPGFCPPNTLAAAAATAVVASRRRCSLLSILITKFVDHLFSQKRYIFVAKKDF
jgi:hypothetical protein